MENSASTYLYGTLRINEEKNSAEKSIDAKRVGLWLAM